MSFLPTSIFGIRITLKNTTFHAEEVLSDVDAEDTPRKSEIFSCPPGLAREPWQNEQIEKHPKEWTPISEELDEKQIPQAQTTIAQPIPQCHTRDSGTFGGESGPLFNIGNTFIEENDDNEQAEPAPKIMSAPGQSSALDEFQEQQGQVQQPQPQQSLDYDDWEAPRGNYFHDPSTNANLAFIRVEKSTVKNRRIRKLTKEVLFVGPKPKGNSHDRGALKMWVDVPLGSKSLNCDQARLHLDGNAFIGLGGCTRYNIMMYVGEAEPGTEWGSDLGDGWHEYGINDFGGDRPICTLKKDIKMGELLAGSSSFIYLGMRLVPCIEDQPEQLADPKKMNHEAA